MSSIPKLRADKRLKVVKSVYQKARVVFNENFMFNHSFGQQPSEDRINDFALVAAYVQTAIKKGVDEVNFSWKRRYHFPSDNVGTLADLVNSYRYGWEMLDQLGLYDPLTEENFFEYEEECEE